MDKPLHFWIHEDDASDALSDVSSSSLLNKAAVRFLAPASGDGPTRLDFSVLTLGVLTLGLVLVLEVIRHFLEHAATGHPFFKSLLAVLFSELSILGIVEFFLFLTHMYGTPDLAREFVFAQVHFTLFYTAVLNGIQCLLLAVVASGVGRKIWIQTEAFEVDHGAEIRQEFDRVQAELQHRTGSGYDLAWSLEEPEHAAGPAATTTTTTSAKAIHNDPWNPRRASLGTTGSILVWQRVVLQSLWYRFLYPRLVTRYNRLLLQIQFSELRTHCLEAYQLPSKLKISDYLVRSLQDVLIEMVHVSPVAMLLLTGALMTLHLVSSILANTTLRGDLVGSVMQCIFLSAMTFFVILTLAIYYKMEAVFATIMRQHVLWKKAVEEQQDQEQDSDQREEFARQQKDLFWAGQPKLIISILQFIQFGFAVSMSAVIIFWRTIQESDYGYVPSYVLVVLVCYGGYLRVCARVLPLYTLCTSLGQLVDRNRLHEVVAVFHLNEEILRQKQQQQLKPTEASSSAFGAYVKPTSSSSQTCPDVGELLPEDSKRQQNVVAKQQNGRGNKNYNSASGEEGDPTGADADELAQLVPVGFVKKNVVPLHRPTVQEYLRNYYMRCIWYSNMVVTMLAFFFVGQRCEGFLHSDGVVSTEFFSFHTENEFNFWALTSLLGVCIAEDLVLFLVMGPVRRTSNNKQYQMLLAAKMSFVLSVACLIILFYAEIQRCCDTNTSSNNVSRGTAAADETTEPEKDSHSAYESGYGVYNTKYSTPVPCSCPAFGSRTYGGLGNVEPLVALIGFRILRFWFAKRFVKWSERRGRIPSSDDTHESRAHNMESEMSAHHQQGHGHGHSLDHERQAIMAEAWQAAVSRHPDIVAKHGFFSAELLQVMLGIPIAQDAVASPPNNAEGHNSKVLGQEFFAQAPQTTMTSSILPETVQDRAPLSSHSQDIVYQPDILDTDKSDNAHMFAVPNAPLLRSMCRCDRKLLPLLDEWAVVDVAMTRFELVYFDATDADDPATNAAATKGLRLCDVAKKRRLVGRLQLSDITATFVEREMYVETKDEQQDSIGDVEKNDFVGRYDWSSMNMDTVKIQTVNCGTLYLRFYADLEDVTRRPEKIAAKHYRSHAVLWVQTIVRLCGPDQLKQPLPNFATNTSDELRDFVHIDFRKSLRRHDSTRASDRPRNRSRVRSAILPAGGRNF